MNLFLIKQHFSGLLTNVNGKNNEFTQVAKFDNQLGRTGSSPPLFEQKDSVEKD